VHRRTAAGHRRLAVEPRRALIRRLSSSATAAAAAPIEEHALSEQPDPAQSATVVADRRPRTRLLLALAAGVLLADLVSKLVVVATIEPGEDIRLLGGALYLTQLRNVGAAFSFAEGWTIVFSLVAVVVAVVIVRTARRLYSTGWAVTLGLVLGGALGNLIDRIHQGYVTDFIHFPHWPAFNVADMCITGGVVALVLVLELGGSSPAD
jgi:signal peptidase II